MRFLVVGLLVLFGCSIKPETAIQENVRFHSYFEGVLYEVTGPEPFSVGEVDETGPVGFGTQPQKQLIPFFGGSDSH